ncbi:hypothetical protein C8R46DRAFT_240041 [Mycena filopes]|nr:hypothetical protein C8R46DRAFT_240041 [Mycena filopes]
MDTNEEYIPTAGLDEPDEPSFVSNSGSIFPHAHDFTVTGGTFTTNNYPAAPDVPSDFRMIPWGDIDLQRDLSVNTDSGVIDRRGELNCVRRVYSAKVDGRSSDVTVAVYQGNGAQEEWRRDIATYVSMRHPNIVQICAGASRGNLHATIFHGSDPVQRIHDWPLADHDRIFVWSICTCVHIRSVPDTDFDRAPRVDGSRTGS